MLRNNLLTWHKRVGSDAEGQPVHETQDGEWDCLAEPCAKRIKVGERSVVSRVRVHIQGAFPPILPGDDASLTGGRYRVLDTEDTNHPTLGHLTLLLG